MPSPPEQQGPQAPPYTIQFLLWLRVSQLVLSLQRWQRSQEPGIYVTLQRSRTACSSGFLWLTLPGRIGLTAHGEEESGLSNSSSWDGRGKVRKCEVEKIKIIKNPRAATVQIDTAVLCLTTHQWGKKMCSFCLMRTKLIMTPHLSPPAHTRIYPQL